MFSFIHHILVGLTKQVFGWCYILTKTIAKNGTFSLYCTSYLLLHELSTFPSFWTDIHCVTCLGLRYRDTEMGSAKLPFVYITNILSIVTPCLIKIHVSSIQTNISQSLSNISKISIYKYHTRRDSVISIMLCQVYQC